MTSTFAVPKPQPNSIFSRIPESEAPFLIAESSRILARAKPGSLESLLRETSKVFSEKQYGWEEAVLDGLWFRWPSEVRGQVFCSENALKNYLLLKTMGLPARYAVTKNYDGSGLPHDIVFVPDRNGLWLIDWSEVKHVKGLEEVAKEGIENPEWVSEQEVTERVIAARSGKSFIDTLAGGQMLYSTKTAEGRIEGYAKYFPAERLVEFLFTFEPMISSLGPPLYYKLLISADASDGAVEAVADVGAARDKTLMSFKPVSVIFNTPEEFHAALTEEEKADIGKLKAYHELRKTREDSAYLFSKEIRQAVLSKARNSAAKEAESGEDFTLTYSRAMYNCYKNIASRNPQAAERWFDYVLFSNVRTHHMLSYELPKEDEAKLSDMVEERVHSITSNPEMTVFAFISVNCAELAKFLASESVIAVQQRLCEELAKKTGVPFSMQPASTYLNLLESLAEAVSEPGL